MATYKITCGVYAITCTASGMIYVGGTVNLRRRRARHFTDLRAGQHKNPLLQAAWNQFGKSAFTFKVLETCEPEKLREREQHYFDTLKPFDERGFNIGRDAERPALGRHWKNKPSSIPSTARAKTYIVTSPDGARTRITNLKKFCREQHLDSSSMCAVANGKVAHHKGWRCEHADSEQGGEV